MPVTYRPFRMSDKKEIAAMMKALCQEDPSSHFPTESSVAKTLAELRLHPAKGNLLLILGDKKIVGYCLIQYYWSNEYGGNILNIDEFYVKPDWRGRGLGTDFLWYLIKNRFNDCVALELETMPANIRAQKLYERVGFKLSDRKYYVYDFHPEE